MIHFMLKYMQTLIKEFKSIFKRCLPPIHIFSLCQPTNIAEGYDKKYIFHLFKSFSVKAIIWVSTD